MHVNKQDFSHFCRAALPVSYRGTGRLTPCKVRVILKSERQVRMMLYLAKKCGDLNFSRLMEVYEEGNRENGAEFWPELSENEQVLRAEEEFRDYLRRDFFRVEGAYYAIWAENGRYVSALRMEPFEDGMLLEALETRPDCRRKGYATALLQAVLEIETRKLYSHVSRKNTASLRTHEKCGFKKILDHAVYVDGSVSSNAVTFCKG